MEELTSKKVLEDIYPLKREWEEQGDWWFGKKGHYKGLPYGYDVNVYQDAEDEPFKAIVYNLGQEDENGINSCTDEVMMVFDIPEKFVFDKVYCKNCKFFINDFVDEKYVIFKSREYSTCEAPENLIIIDEFDGIKIKYKKSPSEINVNNDCKYYKPNICNRVKLFVGKLFKDIFVIRVSLIFKKD